MERWLVAKTRYEGLRRLSVSDMLAQDSWPQIESYLTSVRGAGGADLFAEPVTSTDGSIVWYASGEQAPAPATSLSTADRDALVAKLESEHAAIKEVADYLLQDEKPARRRLGALIDAALSFATSSNAEEPLYALDGKPVLVNWGTRLDIPEPPTDPLRDYVAGSRRRAAPPPVPPPAAGPAIEPVVAVSDSLVMTRRDDWLTPLTWLVLALLVATLFLLLLAPCGISGLTGGRNCPGLPQQTENRTRDLQGEIAILEDQLAKAPKCTDEFARRREDAGGRTGAATITLIWEDVADLDLSVICPGGGSIMFEKRQLCGGVLDVDANNKQLSATNSPVENIYFSQTPSGGKFQIQVHKFVTHPGVRWYRSGPVSFKVQITRDGQTELIEGSVTDNERVVVKEF